MHSTTEVSSHDPPEQSKKGSIRENYRKARPERKSNSTATTTCPKLLFQRSLDSPVCCRYQPHTLRVNFYRRQQSLKIYTVHRPSVDVKPRSICAETVCSVRNSSMSHGLARIEILGVCRTGARRFSVRHGCAEGFADSLSGGPPANPETNFQHDQDRWLRLQHCQQLVMRYGSGSVTGETKLSGLTASTEDSI